MYTDIKTTFDLIVKVKRQQLHMNGAKLLFKIEIN